MKLHTYALGYAAGIISALTMLLLTILNSFGIYTVATTTMQGMHLFYTPTLIGTITGMIEAGVMGFVTLYIFAVLYNKFAT